jgi:arginyl-tRNA synthetase
MEIRKELEDLIRSALKGLGISEASVILEYPADISHGDFATNVALIAAKQAKTNPRGLAEKIRSEIEKEKPDFISKTEVAGPGFINFFLSRDFFADEIAAVLKSKEKFGRNKNLKGKKILVEYTDPNPFKEFHIGHLMSNAIGESIARLYENSGASVKRMCYQGDVGPHVAKTLWAMKRNLPSADKAAYLGECYVKGSKAYEDDPAAKKEIDEMNKKVFERSDKDLNKLYDMGRKWSLKHFEEIYKTLGTKFDYNFFESEVFGDGVKIVQEFVKKGIFEKSDGAIVFHAEKFDPKLHTRVFITSQGLPTYETKELGLTERKFKKIKPDTSIVITANEQDAYFQVFLEALKHIDAEWQKKTEHISHGMMRFAEGKMSSRTGNVITGESLIADVGDMVRVKIAERGFTHAQAKDITRKVAVAAIKYSILRQGIASDIIFDAEKSVSFEGDSGPYLQYAAVRAASVLEKARKEGLKVSMKDPDEAASILEKKIARFPEVAARSADLRAPHHIATYLIDLASEFNSYYATTKIADTTNPHAGFRLALTEAFRTTMTNGLHILGIEVPEKM